MPCVHRMPSPALTIVVAAVLGCGEDATSPTSLEPASEVASAQALNFQLISAGGFHIGQLGDGTTTPRLTPKRVAGGLLFRAIFPC